MRTRHRAKHDSKFEATSLRPKEKRTDNRKGYLFFFGRSGGTRTRGLQYPKLARYQLRYTSMSVTVSCHALLLYQNKCRLSIVFAKLRKGGRGGEKQSRRDLAVGSVFDAYKRGRVTNLCRFYAELSWRAQCLPLIAAFI